MARKPVIAIVGAGNLGTALAVSLRRAGYTIDLVIARSRGESLARAQSLAREVGGRASIGPPPDMQADVVWFCVPDSEISRTACSFAEMVKWKGRVALHSSGVLASDELSSLRKRGAAVASVHPMMTFVRRSRPSLAAVSFALEGDAPGVRVARRIVKDLGGQAYPIRKSDKAAYHAWGTFASPLFTSLLAATERVASAARVSPAAARRRMIPILLQTLANYASFGASGAFSGPIVRGDVDTVKRHLRMLRKVPGAQEVYSSLARAALHYLPTRNKNALQEALQSGGK